MLFRQGRVSLDNEPRIMDQKLKIDKSTMWRTFIWAIILLVSTITATLITNFYADKFPVVIKNFIGIKPTQTELKDEIEIKKLEIELANINSELLKKQTEQIELIEKTKKDISATKYQPEQISLPVMQYSHYDKHIDSKLVSTTKSSDNLFQESLNDVSFSNDTLLPKNQIKGKFFDRDTTRTCGAVALLGGALGAAIKDKKRSKGALYGSVIAGGACIAIKYYSKRLKRSNEVAQEYYVQRKSFPDETQTTLYQVHSQPQKQVERSKTLLINSLINVVQGTKVKKLEMVENIFVLNSRTGELVDYYSKAVNPDWQDGGRFENEYRVKISKEIAPGLYEIRTVLTVNGKSTRSNNMEITVI